LPVVKLEVGIPQGSVLGPLLFAVYCNLVGGIITDHGVRYHQYADDTQLHLAMSVDNTAAGLAVLSACTEPLLTSDSSTYRTACSSTGTSQRL